MEYAVISLLNGTAYGLLLFMLSSGLTLTFSMMGVLNFAHASFYMFGAYFAYALSQKLGFWAALVLAPLFVGLVGAAVERFGLRSLHRYGHIPELLLTYGLAYIMAEVVQVIWGRSPVPYALPAELQGTLFRVFNTNFPVFRGFMMLIALAMMGATWLALTRTRVGLVIQASLTHPEMVQALGHDVPRVFMLVFGLGCALAGVAGVLGGLVFTTEPAMAQMVGGIIFVVVVIGGLGSLGGALLASLLLGILQSFAISLDYSTASVLRALGLLKQPVADAQSLLNVSIAQLAPVLPYLLLVLILIFRPRGLFGTRDT
ncbi:MAG: branched-chain amino acid ABC transporter permease [Gammaproteobacteria bacterium]|nr:branched-chain amino acid ABC transporter permease [Gammaproteobacteria bacterium]MBU1440228.1 branched-chain amino acid ABC transporter permease [Gammaproteobacteria bacterium]MBU2411140.1 branched-chain amino acid ABC transporter permease [Gammaproteobacteria bacterium]